jgi:hypothetical protein
MEQKSRDTSRFCAASGKPIEDAVGINIPSGFPALRHRSSKSWNNYSGGNLEQMRQPVSCYNAAGSPMHRTVNSLWKVKLHF